MSFRPQDDLLEDRARLRAAVDAVLHRIADGQLPDAVERQAVDLKEEPARRGRGGVLLAPERRNLAAADSLADDVAAMANSPGGGALIVGVEDATGSLLGTALDPEWLRHRIWERVEVAPAVEERTVNGMRLLALYVAEAREPVEDTAGRLRWRTGGASTPVDRAEWWLHRQERAASDPLAAPSTRRLEDAGAGALALARRLLAAGSEGASSSGARDLLERLGALRPDGALTRAAALLFCPVEYPHVTVAVLNVEGGDVIVPPPDLAGRSLLEQLVAVEDRLEGVNTAVALRTGLVEAPIRSLPPAAIREAVCNGLVHRDWLPPDPVEVTWVQADASLTVVNPGGFVGGVNAENALTTRYARSPALADLFRALGLVEKQGLGVDRMVRELVSLGHRPPRLSETPGPRVRVRLSGGSPVVPVLTLTARVQPAVRRRDVRIALICYALLHEPYVTPTLLAPVLQRDADEVQEALLAAADCRVDGEPLVVMYKDVWLLSPSAIDVVERADPGGGQLARRGLLRYRKPRTAEHITARWLRDHPTLTTGDMTRLTGMSQPGVLRQLERLERERVLERGAGLGRNAHFVAGPTFAPAPALAPLLSDRPATVGAYPPGFPPFDQEAE